MLLNFMKHSRSDIAYGSDKLCKGIDDTNQAVFLEMHQEINYVLEQRILALRLSHTGMRKYFLFNAMQWIQLQDLFM